MISLELKQIGTVHEIGKDLFLVQLKPAYVDGLSGLGPGDRVQVLYWMHDLDHANRRSLRMHPGGDQNKALRGVFSLRSCARPNPIGVTEANIVEVRDNALVVTGLDARDGSPLIDIKASAC